MRGGLRILHAIHDYLPRHRAGSEIYAARLCRELALRHHVTVVCAEYNPARPHGDLTWRLHDDLPVVEIANNWACRTFADTYRPPIISARLAQVLDMVQPHILHVHNLLNLSFDLPATARARGIPVVATLHDYTLVCPSGGQRIHRAESHVCRAIDVSRCARCFPQSPFYAQAAASPLAGAVSRSALLRRTLASARDHLPRLTQAAAAAAGRARRHLEVTPADVAERLARARTIFEQVDLFVAPSASIADEFAALGLPRSKIRVADYGFAPLPRAERGKTTGRLRIGFVGTLVWHKGLHVLLDAVSRLPADTFELLIHGDTRMFPEYVADLRRRAAGLPVRFAGTFDAAQAPSVYAGLDLLVVPSLWLENSPLVIHEAFQAGIPVVGARIGGIVGLIHDGLAGRLYDPESPAELAAVLQSVIDDPAQLARWARHLPPVTSIADDAREWDGIYATLASPAGARISAQ